MNKTLQRCGYQSAQQVTDICAKLFGTGIRGRFGQTEPKTDPAKVTRIIQMRDEGRRLIDIAAEVKLAASTVSYILNGRGKK